MINKYIQVLNDFKRRWEAVMKLGSVEALERMGIKLKETKVGKAEKQINQRVKNNKRYRKIGPRGAMLCTRTIKLKKEDRLPPSSKEGMLFRSMKESGYEKHKDRK